MWWDSREKTEEVVGCICEQWENVYILFLANSGVAPSLLLYITLLELGAYVFFLYV